MTLEPVADQKFLVGMPAQIYILHHKVTQIYKTTQRRTSIFTKTETQ